MKRSAAYPYLAWLAVFTIIPLILVLYYAFTSVSDGAVKFSPDNFVRAFEPMYLIVMWRSFVLALAATAICFLIGYPAAYILARKVGEKKSTLLFLLLVPMWMNFLLRTYSWLTILERNGIINNALFALGLPKMDLLYTREAVVLGMVYNFLSFMILPIYTALSKIDASLIEAAQDLGAGKMNVFFRVIFPLSLPGVVSGVTMVFLPAITTFVIPNLLGGGKDALIGSLIEQQFLRVGDWRFGSAVSVVIMGLIVIAMSLFYAVDSDEGEGGLF
ncbi:MAG: ABC transporter permease [Clostridiales bacterium]|jgi:spermidine/putrescine transport system permease protein|nr:ABC transporter permease [Clostridiales bacterium]